MNTKGPWKIFNNSGGSNQGHYDGYLKTDIQAGEDLIHIRQSVAGNTFPQLAANARLIAAAPELLEALEKLLQGSCSIVAHYHPGVNSIIGKPVYDGIDKARAAIARAEGK